MIELQDVVVVDGCRTAFGRAGEKGIFWKTRAEDLTVAVLKDLIERNPAIRPAMIEDIIWGATSQIKEQGGTLGRAVSMLANWGYEIPGCTVDRTCASGLTSIAFAATYIATGMAHCIIAGGVEHMGHLPMGFMKDAHPRYEEVMGGPAATNMGLTAENIHERYPEFTREMADEYAFQSQIKAKNAISTGKIKKMITPIEVDLADGNRIIADMDQQPRPDTTIEKLNSLEPVFKEGGKVTPGNSSGLNDGACGVLLMSMKKAEELGVKPIMKWISTGVVGVDPTIMGIGPVPATFKALEKANLTMNDIDVIELNEAFAVQALYCIDRLGMKPDDPRINKWGGAIAFGHPLAASGPRLVTFLAEMFKETPNARFGLTTMCVGRGQGYSSIWEKI